MGRLKKYYSDLHDFGWRYVWEYWIQGRIHGKKSKHKAVTHYLQLFYEQFPLQECRMAKDPNPYPSSIWVCWWQGEEHMPEIVRICYASLLKHANGHPVHLITRDNYCQYVEMPEWVMSKFNAGIITITHFSDLLRLALLSRYGGFWLDATLYLSGDLPQETPSFYTLKQQAKDDSYVSNYRWSGYCMGGKNDNPTFAKAYYMLVYDYWKHHNRLINYYILDYVYDMLYQSDNAIREMIDTNTYNNPDVDFLVAHMNRPYNADEWKQVCQETYIHKLSWKQSYREQCDKQSTYYYTIKNWSE